MKPIIISLLLFFTVNAQTIWYVNRDATGANTGRNWADAWTNLDSAGNYARLGNGGINWEIIGDGDTIYVSGGTDSTVYSGQWVTNNNEPKELTTQVVVAPAWHSGHNGDVYFIETSTVTSFDIPVFATKYISNVKFYGFTFIDRRTVPAINWNYVCRSQYNSLVTLDHCRIIGKGTGGLFEITDNSDKITITHSVLENLYNTDIYNDQDIINVSSGSGGHRFTNNLMILRNDKLGHEDGGHRDGIQLSNYGSNENLEDVIANNIIIDMVPHSNGQTGLIYSYQGYSGGGSRRLLIYNNIIVSQATGEMNTITVGADNPSYVYNMSTRIFNNTIINRGSGGTTPIVVFRQDTILIKNNLVINDITNGAFLNVDDYHDGQHWFPNLIYNEIDYNYYSQRGGSTASFYYGGFANNWNKFRSDGYETNGDTVNWNSISFTNKYDTNATGYYTSTGRDLGVDLSSEYPFLKYDILGNERTGNWDMGALEFQGSQSNNINVKSKIFLQGPYNTNSMNTNLSQNGLLPNTQPFNTAPWNYNGNESLSSGASSSFVDWVLVELRSSSNPTQVVSRKAAILKNDGTLINTDGNAGVPFSNVQEGSYYVAVFHRNHLAVMSANPVQLSASSQIYDFTNGMDKAYGTNPMANLGNGIFGMYTGDGNSNGGITIADRNEVWLPQNGTLGYLNGDFNLDGGVTIHDVNLYWNINNGTMTQVP